MRHTDAPDIDTGPQGAEASCVIQLDRGGATQIYSVSQAGQARARAFGSITTHVPLSQDGKKMAMVVQESAVSGSPSRLANGRPELSRGLDRRSPSFAPNGAQ